MKLYNFDPAPNARRVRIFLAEKGIEVETVGVDLRDGGQFTDEFQAINPRCTVPMLELDDGTRIDESGAICRYFEAIQPSPSLMGSTPTEMAVIEAWHRRIELEGLAPGSDALRNGAKSFKDRAVSGSRPFPQIPELAERGVKRLHLFFDMLNSRLGESPYVAGPEYSIADILAYVVIDFAAWVKAVPSDEHTNLKAWYAKVAERPSSKA